MHQDYTAIALLLFTAVPLIVVAATAFFYIKNNDRKTPLKRRLLSSITNARFNDHTRNRLPEKQHQDFLSGQHEPYASSH